MDASDDAGVDVEGPLDPRIQIELENLNNATDEINKLEIELDEAHTAFRQLLSDSTRRLKEIANKVGTGCIEKARCYYKALEVAQQAQIQCQRQAQLFQRASEIHSAAKETVALAESRFMSHQHEWNFDQAWQDMLNHATIKVMDAENQKAECGREHLRRATLFHDAEKKVQHLEEKHRRAIIKSRPYFEVRVQCDEMLATQKSRVEYLQRGVKKAKDAYATSLRVLEDISNQIHQRRRDYDIMTKGPREPGVGAELISPTESLSYENELDKLSLSRMNSLASSEPDIDERAQDFEDLYDLKHRMEHLNARSADGSESNASQWELELQASVERLNTMPIRKLSNSTTEGLTNFQSLKYNEKKEASDNESMKFVQNLTSVKKPLARTDSTTHYQSRIAQIPINSGSNKLDSSLTYQNATSKSSDNCSSERELRDFKLPEPAAKSETNFRDNNSPAVQRKDDIENIKTRDGPDMASQERVKKKISVDTSNLEIAEFTETNLNKSQIYDEDEIRRASILSTFNESTGREEKHEMKNDFHQTKPRFSESNSDSTFRKPMDRESVRKNRADNPANLKMKRFNFGSSSSDSTPAKHRISLKPAVAKSYENNLDRNFVECPQQKKPSAKTSSVKELPLLSIIQRLPESRFSRDKSYSMTNLTENQNLKSFTDNSYF